MSTTLSADIRVLRDLAMKYLALFQGGEQRRRRDLWRRHNSLQRTVPPIYLRAIPWEEVPEIQHLQCGDAFYRDYERWFRMMLVHASMEDDYTFEPWVTVPAVCMTPPGGSGRSRSAAV